MKTMNKMFLISIGGLFPCIGMGYIYQKHAKNLIKSSTLYKEAVDALRQHNGAVYFLGQPIQDLGVKFNNLGLLFDTYSEVSVKVSGPKGDGTLFIKVKPDEENNLFLDSILLQIGKDDSKRLVIKKPLEEKSSDS